MHEIGTFRLCRSQHVAQCVKCVDSSDIRRSWVHVIQIMAPKIHLCVSISHSMNVMAHYSHNGYPWLNYALPWLMEGYSNIHNSYRDSFVWTVFQYTFTAVHQFGWGPFCPSHDLNNLIMMARPLWYFYIVLTLQIDKHTHMNRFFHSKITFTKLSNLMPRINNLYLCHDVAHHTILSLKITMQYPELLLRTFPWWRAKDGKTT